MHIKHPPHPAPDFLRETPRRRMIRVAFLALVATSCSHPPSAPVHTNDCTAAIAGFASGDAARFRPLPTTCTLADVQRTLRSLDTTTRGTLARRTDAMTIHW